MADTTLVGLFEANRRAGNLSHVPSLREVVAAPRPRWRLERGFAENVPAHTGIICRRRHDAQGAPDRVVFASIASGVKAGGINASGGKALPTGGMAAKRGGTAAKRKESGTNTTSDGPRETGFVEVAKVPPNGDLASPSARLVCYVLDPGSGI
eukprot:gene12916-biopygen10797